MSAHGQTTIMCHLTDASAIDAIASEGLDPSVLPDERLRPLFTFAIDYWRDSGCLAAPSVTVFMDRYGDLLSDCGVDLAAGPDDTVEWAITDLKGDYARAQTSSLLKRIATEMAEADHEDRLDVLADAAGAMVSLSLSLTSRSTRLDVREARPQIIDAYNQRASESGGGIRGATLGFDDIDSATGGIHDGELAVLAGVQKSGKSFLAGWAALAEHRRGRSPVLFTLENSIEMTATRIACMAAGVNATLWDRGESSPEEVADVERWMSAIEGHEIGLHVVSPPSGQRSFADMVTTAWMLGADTIIVDQLTFVEIAAPSDRRTQTQQIGQALHDLKVLISTGRRPMPCLLVHQINREGAAAADKTGKLEARHLANSAEVERTADFVFGLYQSPDQRVLGEATFSMLAARRTDLFDWSVRWQPSSGNVRVLSHVPRQ